jgi:hypothetical protein
VDKEKEFWRDSYWNKERLEAHAAPHLEFNPEKKPWVGLTDEEIKKCIASTIKVTDHLLLDAVQAVVIDVGSKLKEKNSG